jgi:hypothetical protein
MFTRFYSVNPKEKDRFQLIAEVGRISGSCHHGMTRPQVADGGTVSNMEDSYEYIA